MGSVQKGLTRLGVFWMLTTAIMAYIKVNGHNPNSVEFVKYAGLILFVVFMCVLLFHHICKHTSTIMVWEYRDGGAVKFMGQCSRCGAWLVTTLQPEGGYKYKPASHADKAAYNAFMKVNKNLMKPMVIRIEK